MSDTSDNKIFNQASPQEDVYAQKLLDDWPASELLIANLSALRGRDEVLADSIATMAIGDRAEIVVARDGSVTFRVRRSDGRYHWLGYSSVPLIAARGNLQRTSIGSGNLAMNGIGNGASGQFILQEMAPYQSLIVIESNPLNLNLVMRLRDFTGYLRRGQLVLLLGDDPVKLLEDFFATHPGYSPISKTTTWAWLSDQENQLFAQQVTCAMERVIQNAAAAVDELWSRQQKRDQERPLTETLKQFCLSGESDIQKLRAANCTKAYTLTDYRTSRDVLSGLAQLGASTDWMAPDRPDVVSHYWQLSRLDRLAPHLIILVDTLRRDISAFLPSSAVCVTILREPPETIMNPQSQPAERIGPNDFIFYTHSDEYEKLRRASLPEERLVCLPPAVNEELFAPVELDSDDMVRYGADVVLVGNRQSLDPQRYQIELSTHQKLWHTIIEEIQRSPGDYHCGMAREYLTRAQRCGVELREDDMVELYTRLIQEYLGEAALQDIYCDSLDKAGFNLRIWGWSQLPGQHGRGLSHWQQSPVGHLTAGTVSNGPELNKLYNGGKIFLHISGRGRPDSYLLDGIAAGAFFLVKSHPRDSQADGLSRFFRLGSEVVTFDSPGDLIGKVRYYLDNEHERRAIARAGREKLLAHHTYRHRGCEMLEAMAKHRV